MFTIITASRTMISGESSASSAAPTIRSRARFAIPRASQLGSLLVHRDDRDQCRRRLVERNRSHAVFDLEKNARGGGKLRAPVAATAADDVSGGIHDNARQLGSLKRAAGAVVLDLALHRAGPLRLPDTRDDANCGDAWPRVGHRAALADLDHDLESRDRCAAREVELTAESMLHAGRDVGDVRPG